ncbi:MAG: Hsp70 family protein [Planctomycetes bacterium]|nr:Hsp70 family protein [Planctomycetota bacterium]
MSQGAEEKKAIQVGVDLGSTTYRAAYVYPGDRTAVVPVPLPSERFRPFFPIAEQIPTAKMYVSDFFPGIVQRLSPEFPLNIYGNEMRMNEVIETILQQVIKAARSFSGCPVDGALVSHPIWMDAVGRDLLLAAMTDLGIEKTAIASDVECICSFFQKREMAEDERGTLLALSAGYAGVGLALVRVTPRGLRVLACGGDQGLLGGNVFDFAIMQSAMECLEANRVLFRRAEEIGPWSALRYGVEEAKQAVQDSEGTEFSIPEELTPDAPGAIRFMISGNVFRAHVRSHVERVLSMADHLLVEGGVGTEELDYVLIEGGSVNLPGVLQTVRSHFSATQVRHLPAEAVAGGAALRIAAWDEQAAGSDATLPSSPSHFFVPEPVAIPGLISICGLPSERDGAGREVRSESPTGVLRAPESQKLPAVETLTLSELRERIRTGDVEGARRDMIRLGEAIREELETIRRREIGA